MNSKKIGSKLKGFTLMELVVVMAIIAALAGIISLSISGFQRNARMETNNNKAQMVYTGMQNQVIQCEVKQDSELFDMQGLQDKIDGATTPAYKPEDLTYVMVGFSMSGGNVGDEIDVWSYYQNSKSKTKSIAMARNDANEHRKKQYKKLETAILSAMDKSFEGTALVFIDFENYTVDSACYYENANFSEVFANLDSSDSPIGMLSVFGWKSNAGTTGKAFKTLEDMDDQKELIKYNGTYFGVYPFMSDFNATYYSFS